MHVSHRACRLEAANHERTRDCTKERYAWDGVLRVVRRWFVIANAVAGNVSDVVLDVAANPLAELLITLWRALRRYRRSIVRSERMTEAKEMYERYSRNAGEMFDGQVTWEKDTRAGKGDDDENVQEKVTLNRNNCRFHEGRSRRADREANGEARAEWSKCARGRTSGFSSSAPPFSSISFSATTVPFSSRCIRIKARMLLVCALW